MFMVRHAYLQNQPSQVRYGQERGDLNFALFNLKKGCIGPDHCIVLLTGAVPYVLALLSRVTPGGHPGAWLSSGYRP